MKLGMPSKRNARDGPWWYDRRHEVRPRVRDNGFRRRDLSRFVASRRGACVLQARFAPPDPYPLDRLPSLYIFRTTTRWIGTRHTIWVVGTPRTLKRPLYFTFLVKAARLATQSMMSCHSVFALSILALSITATVWIPTVQVTIVFSFLTLTKWHSIVLEIVSNCKSRERKRSLSSQW